MRLREPTLPSTPLALQAILEHPAIAAKKGGAGGAGADAPAWLK